MRLISLTTEIGSIRERCYDYSSETPERRKIVQTAWASQEEATAINEQIETEIGRHFEFKEPLPHTLTSSDSGKEKDIIHSKCQNYWTINWLSECRPGDIDHDGLEEQILAIEKLIQQGNDVFQKLGKPEKATPKSKESGSF